VNETMKCTDCGEPFTKDHDWQECIAALKAQVAAERERAENAEASRDVWHERGRTAESDLAAARDAEQRDWRKMLLAVAEAAGEEDPESAVEDEYDPWEALRRMGADLAAAREAFAAREQIMARLRSEIEHLQDEVGDCLTFIRAVTDDRDAARELLKSANDNVTAAEERAARAVAQGAASERGFRSVQKHNADLRAEADALRKALEALDAHHKVVVEAVRAVGGKSAWDAPRWNLHVPAREANALFDLAYDTRAEDAARAALAGRKPDALAREGEP